MFCSKCGEKLDEGVKFCSKCGEQISIASIPDQPIAVNSVTPNSQTIGNSLPIPPKIKKKQGFANTSLIFGILATIQSFLPIILIRRIMSSEEAIAGIPAEVFLIILSLTFGLISFIKTKNGKALAGVILSGVAIVFVIISLIL
ncbi:hypothetical protein TREPR_2475 [Treponema primitia ZAS-2]|uniref:Zinc-ribbon domain-containing protein n=1 Tax=Treponema primitia (strain ATCC BAA-887 / DSM 12427 / ZAS-2) TaxID=545694 RepID=F5YH29_TREPZ|nr:zinc ribbon domain-containing protein [Treponema primitia]AEF85989.1 hypothetical protein TREPR_2475 [Treponema primitia ZAS-2]